MAATGGNPRHQVRHLNAGVHNTDTQVGQEIFAKVRDGRDSEVTEEVFESPASIASDEAENRLAHDKAGIGRNPGKLIMRIVAALGGNALLRRGER